MKRLNKRGFTLVELLATVTIMAILMIVAVPNILNTIDRNKKNTYIEDARKLVNLAEVEFLSVDYDRQHKIKPNVKSDGTVVCLAFSFEYLVNNGEIGNGPEGGDYTVRNDDWDAWFDETVNGRGALSFVLIRYDSVDKEYEYGVQLVEEYTKDGVTYQKGVKFVANSNELLEENAVNEHIYIDKDLDDGSPMFRSHLNLQNEAGGYACDIVYVLEDV